MSDLPTVTDNGAQTAQDARKLARSVPIGWAKGGIRTARGEKSEEQQLEERLATQIDITLERIKQALASPALSEAQRSELEQQRDQLEGLQSKMGNGLGAVSADQILSAVRIANAAVNSVSGGAASASELSAFERRFGLSSYDNARTAEDVERIYRSNMDKLRPDIEKTNQQLKAHGIWFATPEEEEEFNKGINSDDPHDIKAATQRMLQMLGTQNPNDPRVQKAIKFYQSVQAEQDEVIEAEAKVNGVKKEDVDRYNEMKAKQFAAVKQDIRMQEFTGGRNKDTENRIRARYNNIRTSELDEDANKKDFSLPKSNTIAMINRTFSAHGIEHTTSEMAENSASPYNAKPDQPKDITEIGNAAKDAVKPLLENTAQFANQEDKNNQTQVAAVVDKKSTGKGVRL